MSLFDAYLRLKVFALFNLILKLPVFLCQSVVSVVQFSHFRLDVFQGACWRRLEGCTVLIRQAEEQLQL